MDRVSKLKLDVQTVAKQTPEERVHNFNEVYKGFTPEQAMLEAQRCLLCEHSPCSKGCPLHNDIPNAMWYIEQGDFVTAASIFLKTSNFPDVCGRICPQEKQCEGNCVLTGRERAANIGQLEAFVIDYVRKNYGYPRRPLAPATGMKVAIVGSGPAGLAVAEELTVLGHSCTVFEQWPKPGGLLLYGIPNFKLNKELVKDKIKSLEDMGIKFVCNAQIGKKHGVEDLLNEGFDMVFLGHGAIKGGGMKTPGEDLKNIYQATEYLVRGNVPFEDLPPELRALPHVGTKTIVVGGGDTGMDCVRTAKRLNPDGEVWCVYRRTEAEMPGRGAERTHAKEEGVKFEWLTLPVKFIADDEGKVKAAECIRMKLGAPDAKGRRSPVPIEGSNFILECDTVVLAIGYSVEPEIAETTPNLKTTKWGTIWVKTEDEASDSGQTSREEIYAAGDNVRGADLVVTAVSSARHAAAAMHESLAALKASQEQARLAHGQTGAQVPAP